MPKTQGIETSVFNTPIRKSCDMWYGRGMYAPIINHDGGENAVVHWCHIDHALGNKLDMSRAQLIERAGFFDQLTWSW
jgi:hypothetical protein